MPTISTLGDLESDDWVIYANCTAKNCGRGRPLDLPALIKRFGRDYSVINETEIASRLRCECGHLGGKLTFRPRTNAG